MEIQVSIVKSNKMRKGQIYPLWLKKLERCTTI